MPRIPGRDADSTTPTACQTGHGIIPFPPLPAWFLLPFVAIWHAGHQPAAAVGDLRRGRRRHRLLDARVTCRSATDPRADRAVPRPRHGPVVHRGHRLARGSGPTSWPSAACSCPSARRSPPIPTPPSPSRSADAVTAVRRLPLAGRLVDGRAARDARRSGGELMFVLAGSGTAAAAMAAVGVILCAVAAVLAVVVAGPAGRPGADHRRRASIVGGLPAPDLRRALSRRSRSRSIDAVLLARRRRPGAG